MIVSTAWLGYAGIGLCVVAYLPQVVHLVTEHCSAGLSPSAYGLWTLAALLLLAYAIFERDTVFVSLQSYHPAAGALVLRYCLKYRGQLCEEHGGEALAIRVEREESERSTDPKG